MTLVKCKVCGEIEILPPYSGVDKKNWAHDSCKKPAMPVAEPKQEAADAANKP